MKRLICLGLDIGKIKTKRKKNIEDQRKLQTQPGDIISSPSVHAFLIWLPSDPSLPCLTGAI